MSFTLDSSLTADVLERARLEPDREVCGFIVQGARRPLIYEATNTSQQPSESFDIHPSEWVRAETVGPVLATYHSHVNSRLAEPSEVDRKMCNALNLPMLIVSTPSGAHAWVKPGTEDFPYNRRPYHYGVFDCYELVRDYYRREFKIELPAIETEFGWWNRGENLFAEWFPRLGFWQVPSPRVGDVVAMQLESKVPDHLGVYARDCELLHHLANRLSGPTVYGRFWRERTRMVLRHKTNMKLGDVYYDGKPLQYFTRRWGIAEVAL